MRWDHQWVSCEKDNAECKPLFQLHRTPPIFTVRVAWPVQKVSKKQQWDSQEARAAAGETRRRGERREERGEWRVRISGARAVAGIAYNWSHTQCSEIFTMEI